MAKTKYDSALILVSNESLRKGLAIGLFDIFLEITSASEPDEILFHKEEKEYSFIITETYFENFHVEEILDLLSNKYPEARLILICDSNGENKNEIYNKYKPSKIYSNIIDLKKIINDVKKIYKQ